jgi:hypothetical protein
MTVMVVATARLLQRLKGLLRSLQIAILQGLANLIEYFRETYKTPNRPMRLSANSGIVARDPPARVSIAIQIGACWRSRILG